MTKTELFRKIYKAADELVFAGKIKPTEFMDYMLGGLFYRFISENLTKYINKLQAEAGEEVDYAQMPDSDIDDDAREMIVKEKGFFILPSQLFENVTKRAEQDVDLNETLANIFVAIEDSAKGSESEADLKGLFDNFDNYNKGIRETVADRNKLLAQLLIKVADFDFGEFENLDIDIFGDCYEMLLKMYASQSGTKGGEFYTPQEVSRLLTQIVTHGRSKVDKVYDPACGSGSLLLNCAKILGRENVREGFYGQEINLRTYNLCRMNMFLHNINYDKFDIQNGDTLLKPLHLDDAPFDAIVSNPPYGAPWVGKDDITLINDDRYAPAGVLAPKNAADYAFIMHILYHLAEHGTAAVVEFPGILFRSNAEGKIRKYLVDNNYIDTIIQLPSNLFFGATVATCILVLKKNKANTDILFIDASNEFVHPDNKNALSEENQKRIFDAYVARKDEDYFAKVASYELIKEKDYNLSTSTYVKQQTTQAPISIQQLNEELREIVARQSELRNRIDSIVEDLEKE